MTFKNTAGNWLLFGFFGFPVVCLVSEIVGWAFFFRVLNLGLDRSSIPSPSPLGWGGLLGLFLGAPLGIITALVCDCWKNERYFEARAVAFIGALLIGGLWLKLLLQCHWFVWIGDFGFAVPPLAWAAGLLLFAILAQSNSNSKFQTTSQSSIESDQGNCALRGD